MRASFGTMVVIRGSTPIDSAVFTFPEEIEFLTVEYLKVYIGKTYGVTSVYNLDVTYMFGFDSVTFEFETRKTSENDRQVVIPRLNGASDVTPVHDTVLIKRHSDFVELNKTGVVETDDGDVDERNAHPAV